MAKVSVLMITYNHEKYITQAIEGVLRQECDFEVELIVANDNSPDRTDDVIMNYLSQTNIPKNILIKYTKHEANKGMHANFVWATEQCKGEYIAMCEGDDYWLDPLKLQKQVDFLEANKDYVLIHSDIAIKNSNGEDVNNLRTIISKMFRWRNDTNIVRNLVKGNYIMTLTVVIAKNALFEAIEKITENDNQVAFIDYTLFLELSKLGKIHYQEDKTAVYRILPNSASNSINLENRLRYVESTINISRFYNQKFSVGINNLFFDRILLSAQLNEFAKRGLFSKWINTFFNGIKYDKLNVLRLKNYYSFIILILSKIK